MIRDLHLMTDEDLEKRLAGIYSQCSHWKSCKDGSHGAALHAAGLYDVIDEIKKREDVLKDD